MTAPAVQCVGLVHVYRVSGIDIAALRGVDLAVRPGEKVALFGPSGSGKSTLLAVLAGIRQPSAGEIRIDGVDIARAPERVLRQYRRSTAGVLLQDPASNLLGYATPLENIGFARRGRRDEAEHTAAELLDAVGLDPRDRHRPVAELSRASQQTAALATALANSPRLLLADEPTSDLNHDESRRLISSLLELATKNGTTVVVVTHDPGVAGAMDRTLLLRDGRVGAEHASGSSAVAVVTADGSIQLPDETFERWPAGTRVAINEIDRETLSISRVDDLKAPQ
jgi:putative ABC transport system ATP-binding protein